METDNRKHGFDACCFHVRAPISQQYDAICVKSVALLCVCSRCRLIMASTPQKDCITTSPPRRAIVTISDRTRTCLLVRETLVPALYPYAETRQRTELQGTRRAIMIFTSKATTSDIGSVYLTTGWVGFSAYLFGVGRGPPTQPTLVVIVFDPFPCLLSSPFFLCTIRNFKEKTSIFV